MSTAPAEGLLKSAFGNLCSSSLLGCVDCECWPLEDGEVADSKLGEAGVMMSMSSGTKRFLPLAFENGVGITLL